MWIGAALEEGERVGVGLFVASPRCAVIVLAATTPSTRADAISHYVNERMRELRLPGVALAVVRGGEIVTIGCFGSADLEHALPVSEDIVFEMGSLTKQFTAVALMMRVEEGKGAPPIGFLRSCFPD